MWLRAEGWGIRPSRRWPPISLRSGPGAGGRALGQGARAVPRRPRLPSGCQLRQEHPRANKEHLSPRFHDNRNQTPETESLSQSRGHEERRLTDLLSAVLTSQGGSAQEDPGKGN